MYLRPAFTEIDPARIAGLIEANPFGLLVTHGPDGIDASHLPFVLRRGASLVLEGHLAAANRQCQAIADGCEALVIVSGPHAYVAPGWYQAQPSVPTWDYCAVHVHGRLRPLAEHDGVVAMLDALARDDPQRFVFSSLPADYAARMLKGIRAFRLTAERVEAQWKMSQNRSEADRRAAIAGLRHGGHNDVADLVEETLGARPHGAG